MSSHILGKQRQAVLLAGEPLEDVDIFQYVGGMFVRSGTERIISRVNLAVPHFLICNPVYGGDVKYLRTKIVVRSILLYGCEP